MTLSYSLRCIVIYLACTSSLVFSWSTSKALSVSSSEECRDDINQNQDHYTNNYVLDRRSAAIAMVSSSSIAATTAAAWTVLPPSANAEAEATTTNDQVKAVSVSLSQPQIPSWNLEGGVKMPVLALNTAGLTFEGTNRAMALAYKNGITHVDFHPGRERDGVARYLAESDNRKELFLNTKINPSPRGISPADAADRVRDQIADDLDVLNVKNVDMLMLRDSPDAKVIQSQWAAMDEALEKGQTRSIGVINFCEFSLTSVLKTAKIKPALNYYLTHVGMGLDPKGLRSFGESFGIRTFAYGAIGEPGPNKELLENPLLVQIAKSHSVSPEAVALRWVLQTGAAASVRPTIEFGLGSSACGLDTNKCDMGLRQRASSFKWELTTQEMDALSALTSPNDNPTLFSSSGCPDAFGMKEMIKYLKST